MTEPTGQRDPDPLSFFQDRFDLDDKRLATALDTALEREVDYADLFFEYATHDSVALEESIVKSGSRHIEQGVGVRAQAGERQGYAHSDDITVESVQLAAKTARAISQRSGRGGSVALAKTGASARDLYAVETPPTEVPVERKVDLLGEIDSYARSLDSRVKQVMASAISQHRQVLVVGSDGTLSADVQPLVRLNVQVVACDPRSGAREIGYQGMGGRFEFDRLCLVDEWKPLVDEAVRIAIVNLDSVPCPAGTMNVVLGPGWPGILLHEAIGHGLEGDFNRKQTSAFSDKLGQRVAADGVTVVDDGTLPGRRGSLNVDDEGTPTRRTVLIEDGILVGYLQDRLNARLMGMQPTGNGRRESYAHIPMPRMTNTFMLAGEDDPAEILASIDDGLYAVSFGGGQVDITSGKFVFSASEAYRIEGGRIGAPVKGATLIGNGPDVLTRVSRIGNDLELDRGVGTCGKDGQSVPVGVGLPTLRIDGVTVGGTAG
ncbi:MAG: metalloprotease TldD [Deltaproteobacteria bacterium]|nr:metalloprotease TldD [Deltaproteobacteria bacterium]MBW2398274.1 metalloprotease TldD [Deltaproteobacteria bacterium]